MILFSNPKIENIKFLFAEAAIKNSPFSSEVVPIF
jgi:hypothetical protein